MCSFNEYQSFEPVYAVLDVGTTGRDRKEDRIIQIGVIKVENDEIKPWMTYVNPKKSNDSQLKGFEDEGISPKILHLNKLTFEDIAPKLREFLEDVEYVFCYNCLFDWSFLVAEFGRLQDATDKEEGMKLLSRIQWIDVYRLAIKTAKTFHEDFKDLPDFKAGTLFNKFSIHPKKAQTFHYQLSCTNSYGEQIVQEFTLSERNEECWKEGLHDAVGDSLATNSLLKKLLEKNNYSNIVDLLKKFPQCRIDTELFLAMERLLKEGKTLDEDLIPFAASAGEHYDTFSLRGKTLADSPSKKIDVAYHFSDEDDERIRLIFKAALLRRRPLVDSAKRQLTFSDPNPMETNPKTAKQE